MDMRLKSNNRTVEMKLYIAIIGLLSSSLLEIEGESKIRSCDEISIDENRFDAGSSNPV